MKFILPHTFIFNLLTIISLMTINSKSTYANETKYFTYLNNFGELYNNKTIINDNKLWLNNSTSNPIYNLVNINCTKKDYSFFIRLANINNNGKNHHVTNINGKKIKISNPTWGIVWNYKDSLNFYSLELNGVNTTLDDELWHNPQLDITLRCITNGVSETIKKFTISNNIDAHAGFNMIKLENKNNTTNIYIGNKELALIYSYYNNSNENIFQIGYYAGCGSNIVLERCVIATELSKEMQTHTKWNKSSIDTYIQNNTSKIIGIWHYLDRNILNNDTKIGGKYTLAIVPNNNGIYDILYYDDAKVNNNKWQCGMLKGQLQPTKFKNTYNLLWYDSMMNEINDDCYAQIDDIGIISFIFPITNSTLRFSKQ